MTETTLKWYTPDEKLPDEKREIILDWNTYYEGRWVEGDTYIVDLRNGSFLDRFAHYIEQDNYIVRWAYLELSIKKGDDLYFEQVPTDS